VHRFPGEAKKAEALRQPRAVSLEFTQPKDEWVMLAP
jgi:hypothetical protein